ncbi:GNAT family N-acetyltransferase [Turneriella parva]|uniref:GCN5-related N-acetyltransferase n=1 Tax=Turneriella parva (strain ATCC BAA-1111 / DSM 21527 / NCTC 11395 / H) TaxID=869212 RepID=I4B3X5_TURPD|nr:GNAT family N-acetyltransferase [Turneriella parva]AFM11982.1 GCN5-related N-acetyltransferase [Turneriella parva DSM 21527]
MNKYALSTDRATAIHCLSSDVFAHLMTLKMLTLFPQACVTTTYREGDSWSCLTLLDISASGWDSQKYPNQESVVFLDGNNEQFLKIAFENAPKKNVIFKVHDSFSRSQVAQLPGIEQTYSFLSYSTSAIPKKSLQSVSRVQVCAELTAEAIDGFEQNAYTQEELQYHFQNGARWLRLDVGGACVSQCLVFQNFNLVWEIGGVFTPPALRRKGYAKKVVNAAIRYLRLRNRLPRYQFEAANQGSRALAESVGLNHVLTVDHFKI